ncbi:MAG: hypothetical protein IPH34_05995 [Chitinophagaceae bacterium]|nr:hypothetical protein [Chitinophagaceae bacterium]
MNELIDGAELYSRIEKRDNAESYLQMIHKKAELLHFGNTHEQLNLA